MLLLPHCSINKNDHHGQDYSHAHDGRKEWETALIPCHPDRVERPHVRNIQNCSDYACKIVQFSHREPFENSKFPIHVDGSW